MSDIVALRILGNDDQDKEREQSHQEIGSQINYDGEAGIERAKAGYGHQEVTGVPDAGVC